MPEPPDMGLLNYTYGLVLPSILLISIPLAIFAVFTTTLAFSVLLFRVALVYAELAVTVVPHYLLGITWQKQSLAQTRSLSAPSSVPGRRRKRGSSGASGASGESITPNASNIGFGLNQSIGPQRDFEGVGGWRLDVPSEDDSLWTSFNARLELQEDHIRQHRRSLTAGSTPADRRRMERSYSPQTTMTSPNTSRARTPPSWSAISESYFPPQAGSSKLVKRMPSNMAAASISSGSSKESGGLSISSMPKRQYGC